MAGTSRTWGRKRVLLLTATVDVRGVGMLARTNPEERYEDYRWALQRWANCPGFDGLVFVENSGWDISGLREIALGTIFPAESLEFLSFDGQDFPRHLGKGFGEAINLEHVLEHSRLLASGDVVVLRSNGRNVVENADVFLDALDPPTDVVCDLQQSLTWADGRVLGGTVDFFRSYVRPQARAVDDSAGYYFEHALARAIHGAMADGLLWSPFPEPPVIRGFSGTSNQEIADNRVVRLARKAQHRLKLRFLRR
jgi:hypothetical protein